MKLESLKSLYLDELKDAYDFEHQLLEVLPKMEKTATAEELKSAFREHCVQTERQVERLKQVFASLGHKPERKTCKGMKGLIAEGDEYLKARGDRDTIDASLISAAQRVEHYEMAVYGTLREYARVLGVPDQGRLLQQNLDEEKAADQKLTQLAEQGINVAAA
ncbi:MAG TPA: ferritin-like domain-containing protein [Thermoanaerobaculia bacterium]|nr:ferritin-like domain-containing protein [Thermoanaerobaculia bacterium]